MGIKNIFRAKLPGAQTRSGGKTVQNSPGIEIQFCTVPSTGVKPSYNPTPKP